MIGVSLWGSALGEIYSNADGRQFLRTTILYAKSRADDPSRIFLEIFTNTSGANPRNDSRQTISESSNGRLSRWIVIWLRRQRDRLIAAM
jgi:hypothetical protein